MKPRRRERSEKVGGNRNQKEVTPLKLGLVLSGGGTRAAYQAGALRALIPYLEKNPEPISIILGSSIGAVNGLVIGACLQHGLQHAADELRALWVKRTFRNTFSGSPSMAFFRAIRMAFVQYMAPGPKGTDNSIFDPGPLMKDIDDVIVRNGGLHPDNRIESLESIGVMTTVEGDERKPLLFLNTREEIPETWMHGASFNLHQVTELTAKYGFASAALPSVLPPVEIDTGDGKFRLIDGGISQNVPVDPAVRLGAERVIILDISGRSFWLDQYNEAHDTRPTWEVPAGLDTFCMRPPETFVMRNSSPFGGILKDTVGNSSRRFIETLGPIWPVFKILKNKLGEALAYEVMTYAALDPEYLTAIIELGYKETSKKLKEHSLTFDQHETMEEMVIASSEDI